MRLDAPHFKCCSQHPCPDATNTGRTGWIEFIAISPTFVGGYSKITQLVRDLTLANKLDAGKLSLVLAQWTWKPSPKSVGVDADEHDREPVDEQKRYIVQLC